MATYDEGDVIYAPSTGAETQANPVEILASTAKLHQKGGTLKTNQGYLPAGTAVKYEGTLLVKADPATPAAIVGFLRLGVNADARPKQGVVVLSGILKGQALVAANTGLNLAAAATALNGRYDATRRVFDF